LRLFVWNFFDSTSAILSISKQSNKIASSSIVRLILFDRKQRKNEAGDIHGLFMSPNKKERNMF
jgi:hypothetical protein